MKVIFLDIDGVMNAWETQPTKEKGGMLSIHAPQLKQLQRIIEETGAKIVLSSTWRLYPDLKKKVLDSGIHFIDCTPCMRRPVGTSIEYCERGKEIQDWLDRHPDVEDFVIIDDDNDMTEAQQSHYFRTTSASKGLRKDIANDIISYLNKHGIS